MKKYFFILLSIMIGVSACSPASQTLSITSAPVATQIVPSATESPTSIPFPTTTPASYPSVPGSRAIFTYYFYWYDNQTGSHMDLLTDSPADLSNFTFRNIEWHKQQLKDIAYAGIDSILPIYWYDDGNLWWSRTGIDVLSKALEQVREEGITPPTVGMFLDSTSSSGVDLRLESQQAYVYENIHYFFNTIPRSYWAITEDNRPILWFYTGNWPSAYDQSFIDYIYDHFQTDFGVKPYLVFEASWDFPSETQNGQLIKDDKAPHLKYDAEYNWGGALGLRSTSTITAIGPGYDDHLIPDRNPPSFADRQNGNFYKNNFIKATMCGTPWLALETWNEFHEATDIAESRQYGRQYIEITHEFTPYFKDGKVPGNIHLISDYADSLQVSAILGENNIENGLSLVPSTGDGQHISVTMADTPARQTVPMVPDAQASYLYFSVDDGFYFNTPQKVRITVNYFDNGYEPIFLQYDTAPCGSAFDIPRMYKETLLVKRHNSKSWQTASIEISDATFAGNENFSSDFRLATLYSPLIISDIKIDKVQ